MALNYSTVLGDIYFPEFCWFSLRKKKLRHIYHTRNINTFHSCISNGCTLSEDYHLFQLFFHCWFKVWRLYNCNETLAVHLSLFTILAFVAFSSSG